MKKTALLWLSMAFSFFACSSKEEEIGAIAPGIDSNKLASSSSKLENKQDLDVLMSEVGESKYVLLGEASHGTKEYYTWRAEISKRLIEEKGFTYIAVEGDWPDLYRLNQYIKGDPQAGSSARAIMQSFNRWPTWMWANEEMASLVEWLKAYNSQQPAERQVGLYGMDVYSLWDSLDELEKYLQQAAPHLMPKLNSVKACFAPFHGDEQAYGESTLYSSNNCADELASLYTDVQAHVKSLGTKTEAAFNAEQNALIAVNAERYYQQMYRSNAGSWNLRDRHMMETINRLTAHHGANSKAIVWAHNTHVGDARATDMAASGEINIGQLVRQEHGSKGVHVVGFGSYEGSVIAASSWGAPMQVMPVPAAKSGSWEALLHSFAPADKLVVLRHLKGESGLNKAMGNRAIGVSYNPNYESGNYVPSKITERYDTFIFIDKTQALTPISTSVAQR